MLLKNVYRYSNAKWIFKKKKKTLTIERGIGCMMMVICGDSRILFPGNETGSAAESNWNGQKKYETDSGRVKTRARFCNHTFGVCTGKELSHCYVKPNATFMRAPSSRSRPAGMVRERPIWLARLLSETHLKQTGTLGKVECGGW